MRSVTALGRLNIPGCSTVETKHGNKIFPSISIKNKFGYSTSSFEEKTQPHYISLTIWNLKLLPFLHRNQWFRAKLREINMFLDNATTNQDLVEPLRQFIINSQHYLDNLKATGAHITQNKSPFKN